MELFRMALVTSLALSAIAPSFADPESGERKGAAKEAAESPASAEPVDPKLHRAFELINRSTEPMGWDGADPAAVVRAVNYLHAMGKDQAVQTLRAYVRYAPVNREFNREHAPDQQRLCVIVPLLFVPNNEDTLLPSAPEPILGRDASVTAKEWESFDISTEGDLPFHNVYFGAGTGPGDPDRGYLVEWAVQYAKLRDKPLRPTDDPIQAADDLCEKLLKPDGDDNGYNEVLAMHIRLQAQRSIGHLFPKESRKRRNWPFDDEWQRFKKAAAKLKISWNETEQRYIAK